MASEDTEYAEIATNRRDSHQYTTTYEPFDEYYTLPESKTVKER